MSQVNKEVRFKQAPMEVVEVPTEKRMGKIVLLQPPRINDWREAVGCHAQVVDMGEAKLEISYLLGAGKGKEGSGDAFLLMAMAVPGAVAVLLETDDYLSQTNEELCTCTDSGHVHDHGWRSIQEHVRGSYSGCSSAMRQVVGERSDVSGADLQRLFVADSELRQFRSLQVIQANLASVMSHSKPESMIWGNERCFPGLEKMAGLVNDAWLITRNNWRWDQMKAVSESGYVAWRNYWMNAAIASLCCVVGTQKEKGGSFPCGVFSRGSNADVGIGWGIRNFFMNNKQLAFMHGEGTFRDGDINRAVDSGLYRVNEFTAEAYHEKTGPDGVYMVWGPREYQGRDWLDWGKPRSSVSQESFMRDRGGTPLLSFSDGFSNDDRDPDRDVQEGLITASKRLSILDSSGPFSVAEDMAKAPKFPADDYFGCVARVVVT